jgi:phospholipase/carboxylesterase
VLLAAMVPFREPPAADLTGKRVAVVNGRRDPIATAEHTVALTELLRARGAEVTVIPHDGGHTIDAGTLPQLARFVRA